MNLWIDIVATLAEVIAFAYFFYEKDKKVHKGVKINKGTVLKIACSILILDGIIHLLTYLKVSLTPKLFFLIMIFSIIGRFLYNKNWKKSLFQGSLYMIFLNAADLFVQGAMSGLFQQPLIDLLQDSRILIVGIVISKLLFFIILFFLKKKTERMECQFPIKTMILILVPNFVILLLFSKMGDFVIGTTQEFETGNISVFILMYIIFISCEIFILSYFIQGKEIERRNKMNQEQIAASYEYYLKKVKEDKKLKEIYHDMKEHMLVLQNLQEKGGEIAAAYSQELIKTINDITPYANTKNEIINAILGDKIQKAKEINTEIVVSGDYGILEFMKTEDIVTIFGNALENALEACEGIKGNEKQKIFMEVKQNRDFIMFSFENKFDESFSNVDSHITKKDKELHGFGFKNILRAVEKYDGACKTEKEDGNHILKIVISGQKKVKRTK